MAIGTACIGNCKYNYFTITTTKAPGITTNVMFVDMLIRGSSSVISTPIYSDKYSLNFDNMVIYDPRNPRTNWYTTNNNEFTIIKSVLLSNSKFEELFDMTFDVYRAKKPCYVRNTSETLNAVVKYTYHNPCNKNNMY